jgi:hypothetical protein
MPLIDEFPFRAAVGTIWLINFIIRIIFQSKTKGAVIDFSTHERKAKLYFRLFAFTYLLLLVYVFSPLLDAAHVALP